MKFRQKSPAWLDERLDSPVSLEIPRRDLWMERVPAGMPLCELVRVFGAGWVRPVRISFIDAFAIASAFSDGQCW